MDRPAFNTFSRVAKYISFRAVVLYLTIAAGIFLAIVVINYGGYIDDIHRADIAEALNFVSLSMPGASVEEVAQASSDLKASLEEAFGLNQPFLLRCARWFYEAITFDWGTSFRMSSGGRYQYQSGTPIPVTRIVLERVPYTLLLAGATNILLFFASIYVALSLSKKYGGLWDKLIIALSPLSSIPNWVYGILLTVIFAGELHLLPFNGLYDIFPPATKLGYVPIVLKHMIVPVSSIFMGMFFSAVYTWRTFFLIHSGEDYLEMAHAKGLPDRVIERRYVLKPTLPYLITSFTILLITFWQGIIVLEVFFDWPGLGELFMTSIVIRQMQVTTGIVVVFAFLLGLSVFLLDIIYVLVDPRVKISSAAQTVRPIRQRSLHPLAFLKGWLESYSARQGSKPAGQRRLALPGRRSPGSGTYGRSLAPVASSPASRAGKVDASGCCPYLKVEDYREQSFGDASEYSRCYAHYDPEPVGSAYQAAVCCTSTYQRCPRWIAAVSNGKAPRGSQLPAGSLAPGRKAIPAAPENLVEVHEDAAGPAQDRVAPGRAGGRGKAGGRSKASGLYGALAEFRRYPSAVAGVLIILALIGISIYTVMAIPYKEAIEAWKPVTAEKYRFPKSALPVWVNWFRRDKLPETIIQNSAGNTATRGSVSKVIAQGSSGTVDETLEYTFDFPYNGFPQDIIVVFSGQYVKKPFVVLTWLTPDGREFKLGNFSVVSGQRYVVSQDIPKKYLKDQVVQTAESYSGTGGPPAVQVLFKQPDGGETPVPLGGTYRLRVDATLFEQGSSLDAELVLYGQVYGLAGTDDMRRDLMVALLWGTPVALAFGLLGAVTTGVLSMLMAALGVWFGGWVDGLIQRLTEVNMILPTLPIAITIYFLYSKSIWMILGVLILLSIFGSSTKTYRAAFLQVKELPYIEAAQAYGASNWRIIRNYLVPRIIPLLIPQLVILVPSYVFFEATLAYLNISDPFLPTWGKVVYDSLTKGAFRGLYYWVLEPVSLMILTGLAFAVVGFALDSILNPRLRKI